MVRKIKMIVGDFCANAKPSAGARNGAVQGVARVVASTPLKNAPGAPCFEASWPAASAIFPPGVISYTPNRFSATSSDEHRQTDDEDRAAELHAPAGVMPGGLDANDNAGEREK